MHSKIDNYRTAILANAGTQPKNIMQLMDTVGVWESTAACSQVEYLVKEGFLREHHRDGPYFQHRYFVSA